MTVQGGQGFEAGTGWRQRGGYHLQVGKRAI